MTKNKHFKGLVRARMEKTGESYTTARRNLLSDLDPPQTYLSTHFPGNVPAVSALRSLLGAKGVMAPHNDRDLSEAMVFGMSGGIGAGVLSFRYEKEDFSSLFLAGRHHWQDDAHYLTTALGRLGLEFEQSTTGGTRTARQNLDQALASGGPVIAWVDMALLPYRGMPSGWEGGGYHVVTVLALEESASGVQSVILSDLADEPITIDRDQFEKARSRIKKFKHRLLWLTDAAAPEIDLRSAIAGGLQACCDGLFHSKQMYFRLDAFQALGNRMTGAGGDKSWDRVFPRGKHLWTAMTWLYDCIEHYGTGGGLCRPLFGLFLEEAGKALNEPELIDVGETYKKIGSKWSELAKAALPGEGEFAEARRLYDEKASLFLSNGPDGERNYREIWEALEQLSTRVHGDFPLTEAESQELRSDLSERVLAIYEAEKRALDRLVEWIGESTGHVR